MKSALFILMLCSMSFGVQSRRVRPTVSSTLPTTYATSGLSIVASEILSGHKNVSFLNYTDVDVACMFSNSYVAVPVAVSPNGSSAVNEVLIATSERLYLRDFKPGKVVFCRSDSTQAGKAGQLIFNTW